MFQYHEHRNGSSDSCTRNICEFAKVKYKPIEAYGMIGNMHSAALVGNDGSLDWYCHPDFDSPSIFAALLDRNKGGRFAIMPAHNDEEKCTRKQMYMPDSNVLRTRFFQSTAVGQVTDFMPVGMDPSSKGYRSLVRRVQVARGQMTFRMECAPHFDYARKGHRLFVSAADQYAVFTCEDLPSPLRMQLTVAGGSVELQSSPALIGPEAPAVEAEFTLQEGDPPIFFIFAERTDVLPDATSGLTGDCHHRPHEVCEELFRSTVRYWARWIGKCTYRGRWRETVYRSALALKLLTYQPTGAIVAAPTTSLPEHIGGERNWDYRYTWIRDSAFTVYALMRIGFTEEAEAYMRFIEARSKELKEGETLQLMYGIRGEKRLDEEELDHLEGYMGSKPVRIGNNAYSQFQLDIFGDLMDAVYLYNKWGQPIGYDFWLCCRGLVDYVCDHWHDIDEGIWETRGGRQHFVFSKVLAWVAVDRGLRLADRRSLPCPNRARWLQTRDQIYDEVIVNGWSEARQSFVQSYGSDALDASVLFMPLCLFMAPTDPRLLRTIEAVNQSFRQGGLVSTSLVYRYDASKSPDGFSGEEGTFSICTFWLAEALARAAKYNSDFLEQARLMFEEVVSFANHLGLFSEEIGRGGEALGNFPQAFTHLALISAAFNLDRIFSGSRLDA